MRIQHLGKYYPPERGGIETATEQLSLAGVRLGHNVDCWVAQNGVGRRRDETLSGVRVHRVATLGKLMSTPMAPRFLLGAWDKPGPRDVVHLHLPNPAVELAWLARERAGAPRESRLLPYLHAIPVSQRALGRAWFRNFTVPILARSERILVSSPQFAEALGEFGLDGKVSVLPFCAELLPVAEVERLRAPRRESRTVLALGRLVAYKGYDVMLGAWAWCMERNPSLRSHRLVIAGRGPEEENLKRRAESLGLSSQVEFRGPVTDDEKRALLREATLFVAPSRSVAETFGISILEAMGFGLPVLATRLPTGVSMLTREGECGAVAEPGDVQSLSQALCSLLDDADARDRAGLGNLRFAAERFSEERFTRAYGEILERGRPA